MTEHTGGWGYRHQTWRYAGAQGDRVSADAYLPAGGAPWAALVVAHGLRSDRTAAYVKGPSKAWAREGLVVVAADAPFHGERAKAEPPDERLLAERSFLDRAAGDLSRLVDVLAEEPATAGLPVGFLGFSMGVAVGVRFVAGRERVGAAAFAVGGSTAVLAEEHGLAQPDRSLDPVARAPAVAPRPVAMFNADRDEVFGRRSVLALYDAFHPPKELLLFPGTHRRWEEPGRPFRAMLAFFRDRLGS